MTRLEIAARVLAGWAANPPNVRRTREEAAGVALSLADALLAAAAGETPAAPKDARVADALAAEKRRADAAEARLRASESRHWIQCTSVSNECLGGCASMKEHDLYRQRELYKTIARVTKERDEAHAEKPAERGLKHEYGDDSDCIRCGAFGPNADAECKPRPEAAMNYIRQLAQRVLDLDAQATEGPWEAATNGYCTTLLPDRDWGPHNHASEIAIAYSNTERIPLCATEDEFDASTQDSDDPKVIGQTITDLRLCAEYRTAAPALARALLAALDENARLRALLVEGIGLHVESSPDCTCTFNTRARADLARVTEERDPARNSLGAEIAKAVRATLADLDAAVQRANRLAAQLAGAREVTGIVGENADAIVDALRADLARVTEERDAALSRVEALEAAVAGFFVESRGEGQRVQYVEHDRPMSFSEREWNRHLSTLRDALSGGAAALVAHDAKAVEAERARIAKAVEAVQRLTLDGWNDSMEPDANGDYLNHADVLAAIGAKEPK